MNVAAINLINTASKINQYSRKEMKSSQAIFAKNKTLFNDLYSYSSSFCVATAPKIASLKRTIAQMKGTISNDLIILIGNWETFVLNIDKLNKGEFNTAKNARK